jgi:hypothetical protein
LSAFVINKTLARATIAMNPFALINALVRVVQHPLRQARSAAQVATIYHDQPYG